jgi:DNA-directed RNA polymerase specialized sigma subunit
MFKMCEKNKAKDFLQQLKKLDKLIENKLIEKEQWKAIATGTTAQMGGERVQSSGSKQRMADAIDKYIDIEKEIDDCIDNLIDAKKGVISVIEQLNATEYDLLHKVYVQGVTLFDVAEMCGKTYSWVTTIHGRALKKVENILDEREKDGC